MNDNKLFSQKHTSFRLPLFLVLFLLLFIGVVISAAPASLYAAPPCGTPKGGPCPTATPGGPAPTPTPDGNTEPTSGNLIYNGDFSNGLHRWSMNLDNTAMAYRSVVNGEYIFQIEDPGNNTYSIMLERWDLDIVNGRDYAVYFDARSLAGERTILAGASYREYPWTSYSGDHLFTLTNTMQRFSYSFTMNEATDWDGRIVFQFGTDASDVAIDNIAMYDLTGGSVPPEPALPGPSATYDTLVWSDEFDGMAVNEADWNFEIGRGMNGWGNQELQYYRRENATVANGLLTINARRENYRGASYTSSRLTTMGKQFWQYGRIEMRADLPKGQGIWPAFWTLGENFATDGWPDSGEIDIMEMIGGGEMRDDTSYGVLHWSITDGSHIWLGESNTIDPGDLGDGFHTYSIVWDPAGISWFVDGEQFHYMPITDSTMTGSTRPISY